MWRTSQDSGEPVCRCNVFHPLRKLLCERTAGLVDMIEDTEFHFLSHLASTGCFSGFRGGVECSG